MLGSTAFADRTARLQEHMRVNARQFIGIFVSALFVGGLLHFIDLSNFAGLAGRLRWPLAGPVVVALALLGVAFAYRWRLLLGRKLGFLDSVVATFVGLGGNMLLPARGGDLMRVYFSSKVVSLHRGLSRLLLEKILDLTTVIAVGIGATLLAVTSQRYSGTGSVLTMGAVTLALLLSGLAALHYVGPDLLRWSGARLSLANRFRPLHDHLHRFLEELLASGSVPLLVGPGLFTIVLWLVLYAPTYMLVGQFSGVPMTFVEAAVVLFTSALGLAVPAAPSGIGIFHASVVSGFVILGRAPGEGLVFATVLHGTFLVCYLLMGAVAYPAYLRRRSALSHAEIF